LVLWKERLQVFHAVSVEVGLRWFLSVLVAEEMDDLLECGGDWQARAIVVRVPRQAFLEELDLVSEYFHSFS